MQDGLDIRHIKGIIRRRTGSFLLIFIPLFLVGTAVAYLLPPIFLSRATILIEGQQIPPEYVQTTITSFVEERLQVITQRIMSRGRLLEVINRFDLYADLKEKYTTEQIIEKMRKDIKFKTISADVKDRRTGQASVATIAFTLSYEGRNPGTVQNVANVLTSLYLEENLRTREQRASNTTEFLQQEIDGLKIHMDRLQDEISLFKEGHLGDLPEFTAINLQRISRLEQDLAQIRMQIHMLKERKILLEGQIATVPPSTSFMTAEGKITMDPRERLKFLRLQLISLQAASSDRHPDVIRLNREIRELEMQVGESDEEQERRQRLADLTVKLATIQGSLGPKHPDVVMLQKEIEKLESLDAAGALDAKENHPPSPGDVATHIDRYMVTVENGRVRAAPSLEAGVISRLKAYDYITVEAKQEDWFRVLLDDGRSGWAHQSLLRPASEQVKAFPRSEQAPGPFGSLKPDNPAYINLRTQIESTDLEISALQEQDLEVRKEITKYQKRLERTPAVEKQYTGLLRDYENAKAKYNELTSKYLEAKVALGMEETQRGERFTIIDPAQLPERPSKPNRPAIMVVSLLLSLGAGIGLAAVREVADGSVKSADELRRYTGLPVLSVVSLMTSPEERRARRIKWAVAIVASLGAVVVGLMLIDHFVMPLDVFWAKVMRQATKVSVM